MRSGREDTRVSGNQDAGYQEIRVSGKTHLMP